MSVDRRTFIAYPNQLRRWDDTSACIEDGVLPSESNIGRLYKYDALPAGSWIRVLHLTPGQKCDPIRCSLRPALLANVAGQYDALSYVWGPGSPQKSIEVDGKDFAIRENLFLFLARLRSDHGELDIWVDAICIDQNCADEKNHQVQQMRHVYKESRRTRLWLGPGDCALDDLLYGPSRKEKEENVRERGMASILDNPYWRRLWIVQEVILSPDIQVYLSRSNFSWTYFYRLFEATQIATIKEKFLQSAMYSLQLQRIGSEARYFPTLVGNYCRSGCHDVRDRVFGLLGLVEDVKLQVNYDLSSAEIFDSVIRAYPGRLAEELAVPLLTALELWSDGPNSHSKPVDSTIPVQMVKFRDLYRDFGRLRWSDDLDMGLRIESYVGDAVHEGDTLYSFSNESAVGAKNSLSFLVVLRLNRASQKDRIQSTYTGQMIPYVVAGAALVGDDTNISRETQLLSFLSTQPLIHTVAYKDTSRDVYPSSCVTLEISLRDLAYIKSMFGFQMPEGTDVYVWTRFSRRVGRRGWRVPDRSSKRYRA